ncbi:MAG: hypothetical protein C4533_02285 [Candidatus Omnitrophota bacterium]|jgi:hypothetical protein|nr:MAG: hypothetical protein C4533_02285 [Candidatus Omnitrophota bacterium]
MCGFDVGSSSSTIFVGILILIAGLFFFNMVSSGPTGVIEDKEYTLTDKGNQYINLRTGHLTNVMPENRVIYDEAGVPTSYVGGYQVEEKNSSNIE